MSLILCLYLSTCVVQGCITNSPTISQFLWNNILYSDEIYLLYALFHPTVRCVLLESNRSYTTVSTIWCSTIDIYFIGSSVCPGRSVCGDKTDFDRLHAEILDRLVVVHWVPLWFLIRFTSQLVALFYFISFHFVSPKASRFRHAPGGPRRPSC